MILKKKAADSRFLLWLGIEDSNPYQLIQSQLSYH